MEAETKTLTFRLIKINKRDQLVWTAGTTQDGQMYLVTLRDTIAATI